MTLDEIFDKMPAALDTGAASGVEAIIQFHCSTPRTVVIREGVCTVIPGTVTDFTVAVTMEDQDLADLLSGRLDGMTAFMTGKVQLDGDMMFAQQLGALFKADSLS